MQYLILLFKKAETSAFYLWLLNSLLKRIVPFNKPHGIEVRAISEETITVRLPYKRKNQNHIRGLHACALATLCEYTCGLKLMQLLGPDYRIIMKDLAMDYHLQGKMDAELSFAISTKWLETEVIQVLKNQDAVLKLFELQVTDTAGNKLCTGRVNWQIKPWDKVRMKAEV